MSPAKLDDLKVQLEDYLSRGVHHSTGDPPRTDPGNMSEISQYRYYLDFRTTKYGNGRTVL